MARADSAGRPLDREILLWSSRILDVEHLDGALRRHVTTAEAMRHVLSSEAQRPPRGSTPSPIVAPDVQQSLLELARIALAVATGRAHVAALGRELERTQGGDGPGTAFVTLTEDGALRGCMGLPADAWRDPRTRLRSFRTVRFAGPATRTH